MPLRYTLLNALLAFNFRPHFTGEEIEVLGGKGGTANIAWPVSLVSDHQATLGGGLVRAFHVKASFTEWVSAFYCLVRNYHKPGSPHL